MDEQKSPSSGISPPAPDLAGREALCVIGTMQTVGGAERAFQTITRGLRDVAGMRVRYCAQIPSVPAIDGDAVILRPGHRRPGLRMLLRLRAAIATLPSDGLVFAFQIHPNILAVAANRLLPRSTRRTVIINDRSNIVVKTSPPEGAGFRRRMRAHLIRLATRFTYRRADHIVCNSRSNSELVADFLGPGHPPITTIYNPLDAAAIARRFAPRDRRHFVDPAGPLITAHGRLVDGKGWERLLRAFVGVRRSVPGARLRIVGGGPLEGALNALARELGLADAVALPGHLDDPLPHVEQGDIYVLASDAEGLPNSLLEAIALGLPAISTDCPTGPAEILGRAGEYGLLVPVGDESQLTAAIVDLIGDAPRRAELAGAARRRAEDFASERAIDAYLDLLTGILLS